MPKIRYFIVTQKRKVKISANTLLEASQIADRAFKGEKDPRPGAINQVLSEVEEFEVVVREEGIKYA